MTLVTSGNPQRVEARPKTVHIIQGDHRVSVDPDEMFTTILGSCVAACVRDDRAGVGGMNHFLLPEVDDARERGNAERFGVHLMELLVNALLKHGARRDRMEAKLFGGAKTIVGCTDVGENNARFAERFLQREGITFIGGCLRGNRGRRLQYWPVTGRARRIFLATPQAIVPPVAMPIQDHGVVELF